MKRLLAATVFGALLLGTAACGSDDAATAKKPTATATPEPTTFDVHGSLQLVDSNLKHGYGECWGGGGYDDIESGAQVVIYDNAGAMLGSGSLSNDKPAKSYPSVTCNFTFEVTDVPIAEVDLYAVEIASRGKITFKESDAHDVALTLG